MKKYENINPIGIVPQIKRLLIIILKLEVFSNFDLANTFHIHNTPIAHISKIKKNSGAKKFASPIPPPAKNQEIKNATKPLDITLPITNGPFILANIFTSS